MFEEQPDAKYVAGAVLDLDDDGHLTEMGAWRPEPPSRYERWPRGRQWWVIAPFYLPQSSVFWRRELFDRHGLFARDLNYVFDGEFMCRLALGGEKLALIPGEALSVRGVHEEQKSANPRLFAAEIATFPKRFRRRLTPPERVKLAVALAFCDGSASIGPPTRSGTPASASGSGTTWSDRSFASAGTCWSTSRSGSARRFAAGTAAAGEQAS